MTVAIHCFSMYIVESRSVILVLIDGVEDITMEIMTAKRMNEMHASFTGALNCQTIRNMTQKASLQHSRSCQEHTLEYVEL